MAKETVTYVYGDIETGRPSHQIKGGWCTAYARSEVVEGTYVPGHYGILHLTPGRRYEINVGLRKKILGFIGYTCARRKMEIVPQEGPNRLDVSFVE